jgi:hypothetical protein
MGFSGLARLQPAELVEKMGNMSFIVFVELGRNKSKSSYVVAEPISSCKNVISNRRR